MSVQSIPITFYFPLYRKLRSYTQLIKPRLSSLVVFSAACGFIIASPELLQSERFLFLILGGFLASGAANAFNQILERNADVKMKRTCHRPLPEKRLSVPEAIIVAGITGILGAVLLYIFLNPLSAVLSCLATFLYVCVYTPLKKITPFSVAVGAVSGAIPPLLGWVAATGTLGIGGWILFCIQFIWQFPHFWAIAWVHHNAYRDAGFQLLPSLKGKDHGTALQMIIYTSALIPLGLLTYIFNLTGALSAILISIAGIFFTIQTIQLFRTCAEQEAARILYGSFIYLPFVYFVIIADKLLRGIFFI